MNEMSLWKRMGGWLRRSQAPKGDTETVRLDAEGLLISPTPNGENEPDSSSILPRAGKKENQLAAMEEGFNRLINVLDAINDNVVQHRQQGTGFKESLGELSATVQRIPEALEKQEKLATELNEQLRNQANRQQQLAEMIGTLPELTQAQVDRLGEINEQLKSSTEADANIAESFKRFDQSTQGMLQNTAEQTTTLKEMTTTAQQSSELLTQMLTKQSRRFTILIIVIVVGALGLAAALIYLLSKANPGGS